jgi:hypothetical protein
LGRAELDDDDLTERPGRGQPAGQVAGIADRGPAPSVLGTGSRPTRVMALGRVEAENAGGQAARCRPAEYQDLAAEHDALAWATGYALRLTNSPVNQ